MKHKDFLELLNSISSQLDELKTNHDKQLVLDIGNRSLDLGQKEIIRRLRLVDNEHYDPTCEACRESRAVDITYAKGTIDAYVSSQLTKPREMKTVMYVHENGDDSFSAAALLDHGSAAFCSYINEKTEAIRQQIEKQKKIESINDIEFPDRAGKYLKQSSHNTVVFAEELQSK